MASVDHQLALSRSSPHRHHVPSNVAEKSKGPPAFLQKLFEMLNDPKSTDLIRWSAAGDSFFVLDHERLAREVLPRWFKHQNFSSFVRQLNMYGFHKIPHLQQGVLRSDTDTEFWNFAHPDFIRGHPDLLFRIRRKKQNSQVQQQAEEAAAAAVAAAGLVTDGNGNSVVGVSPSGPGSTGANPSTGLAPHNNSQLLDVHSIVQGIAAIKRHQVAIATELSELKRSNEMLWQDALVAREKHQKQEDTINKIVKFLAGVFGKHAGSGTAGLGDGGGGGAGQGPGGDGGVAHGDANSANGPSSTVQRRSHHPGNGQQPVHGEGNHDGSAPVVSRKRARLMIEDGRRHTQSVPPLGGAKSSVNAVEVTEEDEEEDVPMFDNTSSTSNKRGLGGNVPPTMLNLSDRDRTSVGGGPTRSRQHSRTHGRSESTEYPRIEMEVETPKSIHTPLPRFASPAESIASNSANKNSTATMTAPPSVSNLNNERAITHTPPLIYPQPDNNFQFDPRQFDPRNMMTINLPFAQVQQLLTTLANQSISDPNNGGGEGFESGFLVPLDGSNDPGNRHALQQLQSSLHQPTASPPPFDLSSYLIPSPQLGGMSLANNSPGPSSSPATAATTTNASKSTTTATAKSTTKQNGSGSSSGSTSPPSSKSATPSTAATTPQSNDASSTSFAQPAGVPVPDGLIAFDGPDAGNASASANSGTAATTGVASPGTSYAGDMSVGMRTSSPFVFPFAGGYQDYAGYPTGASTAVSTGPTSGSAATAAAQGYAYGYNPYASPNGAWNTPSNGSAGGGATTDFNGLFSPVLSNQKVGYGSPSIPPASSPSSPSIGMQSPQSHHAYVPYGNNNSTSASDAQQPNLAALAANWRDTGDIDRDVGVLDTTIHSLIQSLGLDSSLMDGFPAIASASANGEDASGGDTVAASNGTTRSGGGRKNSQHSNQSLDFETLLSAWGSSTGAPGYHQHQPHNEVVRSSSGLTPLATSASDSATSGSGSTPSTGEDLDGSTSVTSGVSGSDEIDDGVTPGNMSVVSSPAIPPAVVGFGGSASPIPSSRNLVGQKPNGMGTGTGTALNGSPPRPINKKARTSLTASAPTSAGVPTTVESAGTGRKRRSTMITGNAPTTSATAASSTGVARDVDGAMVDGMLVNGVDGRIEPAQLVGQEQPGTQGQSQGVQKRSSAKAKRRRG